MGFFRKLMFWRKEESEYEVTDCFGEPNRDSASQALVDAEEGSCEVDDSPNT